MTWRHVRRGCFIPWPSRNITGRAPSRNIARSLPVSCAKGERNATLARLAGHLLANCVDPGVAHELLQGWNRGQCTPPLPAAEVERTVASIALAELRKRSGAGG